MVVVEKSVDSLGNIPSTVYVKAQTFTHQFENQEAPTTSTTIEHIETFIQGIKLPGNLPLDEGKAAVLEGDESLPITIYGTSTVYPYNPDTATDTVKVLKAGQSKAKAE